MKRTIVLLLLIITSLNVSAQIKGMVVDSASKKPIDRALIGLVIKSVPGDTSYSFANEKGEFSISPVPSSSFSLVFSNSGYQPVAKFISIAKPKKTVSVGIIILAERATLLGEVIVEAAPIVIKEDTIEYRADAFKVKEDATTEDLLKKLPGIQVDKDGNVTAQGKAVTKVRVNGKDFFGGDVKTATRELPANIIDKVQVIDDYGDQATVSGIKDGNPEKIINLQIKKDKNKGVFGRATAGAGTENRYQASLNANYFNNTQQLSLFGNSNNNNQQLFSFGNGNTTNVGMSSLMKNGQRMMSEMGGGGGVMNAFQNGDQSFLSNNFSNNNGITTSHSIGANYRDNWGKKVTVYGSYSFSARNNEALQTSSTQNFFQGKTFLNNQDNNSNGNAINHRFFFNLEYQIDSFNYIKLSPTVTYASNETAGKTLFNLYDGDGMKTSDGNNNSQANSKAPSISVTLLYNHRFRKKGRNFSANFNLGNAENNNDQRSQNVTNRFIDSLGNYTQSQIINQQNNNHNYGIRLTYSEPLSKSRSLDIAASHNLNYTGNDRKTYLVNPSSNAPVFLPALSNDYENNFYNNRAGISVRTTLKKYNYTLGISVQPVSQQGKLLTKDSSYRTINRLNIFPIARVTYNFSQTKTFSANYSGNATQPSYSQLQDVLDISNPQAAAKGNPLLKPSISHNINMSYNNFNFVSGRVIFTNVTVSTIQNQIVNNIVRRDSTGAQISIPENVNGFYNVLGFYTYSRPFKKRKYVLTLTGTVNYNNNINLVDSIRTVGKNWIASQGFMLEYNYKTWLEFGMGASYSINDVKYIQPAGKGLFPLQNTSSSALTISSNIDIDLAKTWVIKYDFDYTLNYGLSAGVSRNTAILNASIEKQFFKKKNVVLKFAAFDLFNQNANINRSVSANAIIDTRSNRLARFFMLSLTYRLQKFKGLKPKAPGFKGMIPVENKNAEIKVF